MGVSYLSSAAVLSCKLNRLACSCIELSISCRDLAIILFFNLSVCSDTENVTYTDVHFDIQSTLDISKSMPYFAAQNMMLSGRIIPEKPVRATESNN